MTLCVFFQPIGVKLTCHFDVNTCANSQLQNHVQVDIHICHPGAYMLHIYSHFFQTVVSRDSQI